jgi:hypothetical protein
MANPFDQFDAQSSAGAANPFDQFDKQKPEGGGLSNASDDGYLSAGAKSVSTAAVKGLSGSVGTVGNLGNFADYLLARGHSAITGKPVEDVLSGYEATRKARSEGSTLGRVAEAIDPSKVMPSGEDISAPILKRTGEYVPESELGKMAQAGVQAAFGMIGPGGGAAGAGIKGLRGALAPALKMAPGAFAAGSAGQGVTDATGDPLLGMTAGAAVPAAGGAVASKAGKIVGNAVRPFAEDLPIVGNKFAGTRDQMVGERLLREADNPDTLDRLLSPGPMRPGDDLATNIIPGSKPTLGQFSGDMGILQAERQARTADNTAFNMRDADQNAVRVSALRDAAPVADTMRPSEYFQQQLDHIERGTNEALGRIQAGAQHLASNLGPGENPEVSGAALRTAMETAKAEAKRARTKLYDAVDPDGSMSLVATPVRERAQELSKAIDPYDTPMSPVEARIFGQIGSLPDVTPFKSLVALDKNIYAAMSAERRAAGETPTWGRLSQLKKSVLGAINDAVDNQAAYEQAAVASGKMSPADTIDARLEQVKGDYHGYIGGGLGDAQAPSGRGAGADSSGVPGLRGSEGERNLRPGDVAGSPRISARGQPGQVADINDFPIYYPGGQLHARYEVVDHPDLITSHDQNFNPNPKFPQELQPRARESAPARDQVNGMASRLQPERLGPSPEANSGAPIVGPDNVVESGNGRALAIGKAYQKGNTAYRDWMEGQGFDTRGMKQPVLVARRTSEMTPAEREYFANSANSSAGLKMSAAEQASSDAKLVNENALKLVADAPIRSPENRDFVRAFADKLPATERGGILDKDGNLSQSGVRRIEAALAAKAFDDTAFVGRAFDSADSNIRNLAGALVDSAGPWARMRSAARSGAIDGSHDITHELMDVVHKVMRARDEGVPIADILKQTDMFGSDVKPLVESLLFRDPEKGLLASRQRIASGLKTYAAESEKNLAGPRLFGDEVKPRDVFKTAIAKAAPDVEQVAPTFESGAKEPVRGLQPNFDRAAADRLRAAKGNHIDFAETYRNPAIKRALGTQGGSDNYTTPNSALPSKAVLRGPQGYQTAKAFLKAARDDPTAVSAMLDHAASPLRSTLKPDGTINPAKFEAWKKDYAGALRALDEVQPGFSRSFDNAARASDVLVEAGAVAKRQMDTFQKSEAARFLKMSNPTEVENHVGAVLSARANGPTRMRDLVSQASKDPTTLEGVRKAGVDWMVRKFATTAEAGTSGEKVLSSAAFRNFVRDNAATLSHLYPESQVNMFRAIAEDLQRANRSVTATAIKGSPGTAKDALPFMRRSMEEAKKHASFLSAAMTGSLIGFESAGLKGAAIGAGTAGAAYLVGSLRAAGIRTAEDMFRDALLNPERARYYISKIPPAKDMNTGPAFALSRSLRRTMMMAPVVTDKDNRKRAA